MTPADVIRMELMKVRMERKLLVEARAQYDVESYIRRIQAAHEWRMKANDVLCNFWLGLSVVFFMFMMMLAHR